MSLSPVVPLTFQPERALINDINPQLNCSLPEPHSNIECASTKQVLFNLRGEFNVAFGRHTSITYDIMSLPIELNDFIYADSPYDVEFTTYRPGGFTWEDPERTAEWLVKHKGPELLSNQATKLIVKPYKKLGFHLRYLNAPRRISCPENETPPNRCWP